MGISARLVEAAEVQARASEIHAQAIDMQAQAAEILTRVCSCARVRVRVSPRAGAGARGGKRQRALWDPRSESYVRVGMMRK